MDHVLDFIFNVAAHRIGVRVLRFLVGAQHGDALLGLLQRESYAQQEPLSY